MVNLEYAERQLRPATVADAFLLAEGDVLVLAIGDRGVDVGAGGDVTIVEQAAHVLLQAHVDQLDGLGGVVDANPLAAQSVGGDACDGAAAERVEYQLPS